jgi:tetratricopeptide (TPR) repeat protein
MPSLIFVAPSGSDSRARLELTVEPAASAAGFQVVAMYGDQVATSSIEEITKHVTAADLVVADLTGASPNVMFELGVRYATGRPVILLAPEGAEVPFDLVTRRIIFFDRSARGLIRLRQDLSSALTAVMSEITTSSDSPISAYKNLSTTTPSSALTTLAALAVTAMISEVIKRRMKQQAGRRQIVELEGLQKLVESAAADEGQELGPLLNKVAMALIEQGDLEEAEVALRQALRLSSTSPTSASGSLLANLASLYARRGDHEQAVSYYQQALSFLQTEGRPHEAAQVAHNLAAELTASGDFENADKLLQQSISTFRVIGDTRSEATALLNHSILLIEKGDLGAAEINLSKAAGLATEIPDARLRMSVLRTLASLAVQHSDYTRAIDLLQQALNEARSQEDNDLRAGLLRQIGDIALRLDDYDLAIQMLTEAVTADRQSGDRRALGASLSILGNALWQAGDVRGAQLILQEAIEELTGIASIEEIRGLTDTLANINAGEG